MDKTVIKNWESVHIDQKRKVFQQLENDRAAIEGRRPCVVILRIPNDPDELGHFSKTEDPNMPNRIFINEKLAVNNFERAVETLYHESRHAYQRFCVDNNKQDLESKKTIKEWKNNFDNYISPNSPKGFKAYYDQSLEQDARLHAKIRHSELMGGIYKYTLEDEVRDNIDKIIKAKENEESPLDRISNFKSNVNNWKEKNNLLNEGNEEIKNTIGFMKLENEFIKLKNELSSNELMDMDKQALLEAYIAFHNFSPPELEKLQEDKNDNIIKELSGTNLENSDVQKEEDIEKYGNEKWRKSRSR